MLRSRLACRIFINVVVLALPAIAATAPASSIVRAPVLLAEEHLQVSIVARAVQPGEVVRVDVECACESAPHATAFGLELPLSVGPGPTRYQGFIGVDLDTVPGSYPVVIETSESAVSRTVILDVKAKRFPTRTLRVAPEYVDPPADVVGRILTEAALTDGLFKTVTPRRWTSAFVLPLATRPTANFGSRSVFNGVGRNPHAGVDFSSRTGTVVTAPAEGTVALARELYFTGNTVIIDHGAGLYSLFAHLSSIAVTPGQAVVQNATLGRVGATGRATGPHLHWSVRLNGARVDPLSLLTATAASPEAPSRQPAHSEQAER
jgi:hypothetical protein